MGFSIGISCTGVTEDFGDLARLGLDMIHHLINTFSSYNKRVYGIRFFGSLNMFPSDAYPVIAYT